MYKNGEAALRVAALGDPMAERRIHPDAWTQWRRTGDTYQYFTNQGWAPIMWIASPMPPHTRLSGVYSHQGSPNLAFDNQGGFASGRRTGRYEINGYRLTVAFNDGQTVTGNLIIYQDFKLIWLDGEGFLLQTPSAR
jgi:hypothetical protein